LINYSSKKLKSNYLNELLIKSDFNYGIFLLLIQLLASSVFKEFPLASKMIRFGNVHFDKNGVDYSSISNPDKSIFCND
jgi:hypothetical protein